MRSLVSIHLSEGDELLGQQADVPVRPPLPVHEPPLTWDLLLAITEVGWGWSPPKQGSAGSLDHRCATGTRTGSIQLDGGGCLNGGDTHRLGCIRAGPGSSQGSREP